MAWTNPADQSSGHVVTASDWNALVDNMTALGAYGTALPTSGLVNGYPYTLVDSTSAPTYSWRFVYSSTAGKWLFVGGTPALSVASGGTITNTAYTDFASNASITVPRAGDYLVRFGAAMYPTTGSTAAVYLSVKRGSTATADSDGLTSQNLGSNNVTSPSRALKAAGLSASDVLKTQGRASTGSIVAQYIFMEVTPIAVT